MTDITVINTLNQLKNLNDGFHAGLAKDAPDLHMRLVEYRNGQTLSASEISDLLIDVSRHLEKFIVACFQIEAAAQRLQNETLQAGWVGEFKQEFVMKRVRRFRGKADSFSRLQQWLDEAIQPYLTDLIDREQAVAALAHHLLLDSETHAETVDKLTAWCKLALESDDGRNAVAGWSSFRLPQSVDPARLVELQPIGDDPLGRKQGDPTCFRHRDGFALTDQRMPLRKVMNEIHYCVYCHDHDGDFCAKGFPENKRKPEHGLKKSALGVTLTGCPLEEKISEMHWLKREGHSIAALAVAMIDNPMIPATGHRICNDCMKACIYQKKDPVNIPEIETRVLTDVLDLPWGVEIYHLLTCWNPLRQDQFIMQPDNGTKVLISGMGPAGFTMAHHLTMEGYTVVGIDGLKIEPLPEAWLTGPIRDFSTIRENLDERILAGFGGVAEYGITVRWDKNFLSLIYLTLARRPNFQVFGGTRLGGTITLENAWELGFDHVCIANGAGLPRDIPIGNSLARGMRQASDFLMALQLTGAAKNESLANLQVRLPAAVIGGGLTAIDTATEVQAYYIKQVEKVLSRYETLIQSNDEAFVRKWLDEENNATLDEFLEHGRAVRSERQRAEAAGELPDFIPLLRQWGGVSIVYRRGINESPAYQRNHEEVIKALEEGIYYLEGLDPRRCVLDEYGYVKSLLCRERILAQGRWLETNHDIEVPARSIFVAAGTFPNAIYESEYSGTFRMEHDHFLPHVVHKQGLQPVGVAEHCKSPEFGPFTSYEQADKRVSFIGDTHPVFNGSVVKAIASASRSYKEIIACLSRQPTVSAKKDAAEFSASISDKLTPRIVGIKTDNPVVIEFWVHAPLAAKNFQPGQFFRLQMFERLSEIKHGTRLQIPLQTISGAGVQGDLVRLLLLRWGSNAKIAASLKPGDRITLMGPTGAPSHIPKNKTILVIAGTWGAAVMLGLGPALRAACNRVLYFAAYGSKRELYYQTELETTADQIVWSVGKGGAIETHRPQDSSVVNSNLIELLQDYSAGLITSDIGQPGIALNDIDEILVMGGTGLLRALQQRFKDDLATLFKPEVDLTGAVGSPMQCMLKGVCAQCLQWQIDPQTGERTRAVYSCAMQDQPLMWIDIDNLVARQSQNRLQEHLTGLWVDHVLQKTK